MIFSEWNGSMSYFKLKLINFKAKFNAIYVTHYTFIENVVTSRELISWNTVKCITLSESRP